MSTPPAPPAPPESPARPRSGNRRDEAARLAVLHAADDLLVETGYRGLTMEALARRAGVAKQTIYRWWPSKVDVLLDVLVEDSAKKLPVPATAASVAAIRRYLRHFAGFLTGDPAGAVLLALHAEARLDSGAAAKFRDRYLDPRRDEERALIVRATDAGAISPTLPADLTLDLLIGPLVHRAMSGADIPRRLVDAMIRDVLRPAT